MHLTSLDRQITVGSLFSGIGGIDLGLQRAGCKIIWQIENDPFCRKVLQKHWPEVPKYGDITTLSADRLERPDILAGGFPCQPHSLAGQRKASEDERNLWPEFARIIRELKPEWVLAENVLGLLSSEDGHFFSTVLGDLATCGYDAEWHVLRASDVGAPHQRERVFIIGRSVADATERRLEIGQRTTQLSAQSGTSSLTLAHADSFRQSGKEGDSTCWLSRPAEPAGVCEWQDTTSGVGQADAHGTRLQERNGREATPWTYPTIDGCVTGQFESLLGGMPDGFSTWLDRYQWPAGPRQKQHEWEPPRVIVGPGRAARLKALGNAVVPQLAEYIGRCILERIEV